MSYSNHGLVKPYLSGAAIAACRIVKLNADDRHIIQGAASTDALLGIVNEIPATAAEQTLDVVLAGIAELEIGSGGVTRGGPLTSDSAGKGVAATPSAIVTTVVNGGTAGAITVTGIAAADTLLSVQRLDVEADTGTSASGNKIQAVADLTSEFSVSAANTITNAGGTDTSGDRLIVTYRRPLTSVIGYALKSGAAGDIVPVLIDRTKM